MAGVDVGFVTRILPVMAAHLYIISPVNHSRVGSFARGSKELQMFKRIMLVGLLASTVLVTGCASVPMASAERDAQTKTFSVKPDKANIYVYRNESMGAAVKMDVDFDGKPIGQTVAKSYFALEVAPGKHTLISKAENDSTLDVAAEAGKNYFIWQEVKMGILYARNKLQLVDDATGKTGVSECKLIEAAK